LKIFGLSSRSLRKRRYFSILWLFIGYDVMALHTWPLLWYWFLIHENNLVGRGIGWRRFLSM